MNMRIILPEIEISISEWFIKHNVSSKICPPEIAISRALDSIT